MENHKDTQKFAEFIVKYNSIIKIYSGDISIKINRAP